MLEDVDNIDVLSRIFQNLKSEATLKGEAFSSKDIRAVDVAKNFGNMTNTTGQNMRHHLMSGILGDHQEFLIPLSSMNASSGYCFQLELFLNDDAKVVGSTNTSPASYSLEEVSYDMELVEVSDAIMADINSELSSGSQIPLPYKSWRSHNTALSGAGTQHKVDIAESAINAEKIYSVVVPQSWTQKQSVDATKYLGTDYDPYTFYGGRKKLSASGAFTSPTDYVTKYNWRYGSTYYPSAPIELNQDSTVALETTLSTFDLKGNELPFMTAQETDGSGATNRFESRDFILAHNFNKTPEKMRAGLNLANSGAPVRRLAPWGCNPKTLIGHS